MTTLPAEIVCIHCAIINNVLQVDVVMELFSIVYDKLLNHPWQSAFMALQLIYKKSYTLFETNCL